MDKYDEIIGKCPHCGRNLTSDHVCPKLASMTMSTHWEGCWEEHHACAVAAIRELKARLEIDPRHSIDGIAARDETIRMLEEELARLKAPVDGEIAEVVRDAAALVAHWPNVRQLQDGFMGGDPNFTQWDHSVRDESIRLSPAIERIAGTIEQLAARVGALAYFTKLAQRGEIEAISRAESAEAELAKLKAHAEAMADASYFDAERDRAIIAYRRDYPKE